MLGLGGLLESSDSVSQIGGQAAGGAGDAFLGHPQT